MAVAHSPPRKTNVNELLADKEKHEARVIERMSIPDLRNELSAASLSEEGKKRVLRERVLNLRLESWKAEGCPPIHTMNEPCQICHDDEGDSSSEKEKEDRGKGDDKPMPRTAVYGAAPSGDLAAILAMMMEDRQRQDEERRRQEEVRQRQDEERRRQEEDRRREMDLEREERRRELQLQEQRFLEQQRLWFDAAMRGAPGSRAGSPNSSLNGSLMSVGSDAQLIIRKFTRLSTDMETALRELRAQLTEAIPHRKLQRRSDHMKEEFRTLRSFYDDKIDFLDGDEEKDGIVEKMQAVKEEYDELMETVDDMIDEAKKIEKEEKEAGSLPSGVEVPDFYGSPLRFPTWFEEFDALINSNAKVSKFFKMTYLKKSMKGKATGLLDSIPTQAQFYEKALAKVKERFGKNRLVVRHLVGSVLNLEETKASDTKGLRKLFDILNARSATLDAHKPTIDTILVPVFESKLPSEIKEEWEKKMAEMLDPDTCANREQFFEFFASQIEAKEAATDYSLDLKRTDKKSEDKGKNGGGKNKKNEQFRYSAQSLGVQVKEEGPKEDKNGSGTTRTGCSFCGKEHANQSCPELKKISEKDRWHFIINEHKDKRVCIACLDVFGRNGHPARRRCEQKCGACGGSHHKLLHVEKNASESATQMLTTIRTLTNCQTDYKTKEILPTALARIRLNGREKIVRVALDSLAQKSFIRRRLVEELGMLQHDDGEVLEVHGYAGQTSLEEAKTVSFELMSIYDKEPIPIDLAYIANENICSPFEAVDLDINQYPHLEGLKIADPMPRNEVDIDILLGVRHYYSVVFDEKRRPEDPTKEPTAIDTAFGYVISGPYSSKVKTKRCMEMHIGVRVRKHDDLDVKLEKFWEVESLGIADQKRPLTKDEKRAVKHFEDNVKYNGERYEVSLPFRQDAVPLKNNYAHAKRILESTERRLLKNPERRKQFSEAIEQYEKLGFAHELTPEEKEHYRKGEMYFVPSHPVFRLESDSTPTRVVFNASSEDDNGHSLNEMLLPGPPIQPDLAHVLIRFRWHKYVVTGDLKKMFCQVRLDFEDRRYQLYLWRDCDQSVKPREYSMDTLIFGGTSSPFLAGSSVHKHTEQPEMVEKFPRLVNEVKDNTYVDDHYNGRETEEEAIQLYNELVEFFQAGGWKITKFATNSPEVLKHIPVTDRIASLTLDLDKEDYGHARALGLDWKTDEDTLKCKVADGLVRPAKKLTKRIIASKIATIYDVFGVTAPFVIRAKILIQDLWKKNCGWDEEVDDDDAIRFRKWEAELPLLREVVVPRRLLPEDMQVNSISLHGFADASEDAYGCMVYLRAESENGRIWTSFIMAKTKVAPIKTTMIARLELMGAQCLANLLKYVIEAFEPLDVTVDSVHGWTDSEIVLDWIAQPSYRWKTFVANRTQKIHDCFSADIWRHCPGTENPADKLTRGLTLSDLKDDRVYWEGPDWLRKSPEHWPEQRKKFIPRDEKTMEAAKIKTRVLVASNPPENPPETLIETLTRKFEKFRTLVRVLSWVMRLLRNARRTLSGREKVKGTELEVEEIEDAESVIWREIQRKHFSEEYAEIECTGKLTSRKARILCWDPQFDQKTKTMIVGGRLKNAQIPFTAKHPTILPRKNETVRKMILQCHIDNSHAAKETTIAIIREKFAIIHVRQEVRETLRGCVTCRNASTSPLTQKMGDLPEERVHVAPAFTEMGLDFTGALWIKEGDKTRKCYILVCTCPSTRMVHFELTNDMTTDEFIQALKRVMNRRGKSSGIHSDNQTSFKKASRILTAAFSREMQKIRDSTEVRRFLVDQGLKWTFITERSPFRGGYWERLNRSLKEPLKKVLGKALLKYTELYTLLTDIECALNQRPLTFTGGEPGDPLPLTPAHLALGRPLSSFPNIPAPPEVPIGKRYRYLQRLLQQFWSRWTKEYLPNLNERKRWRTEERPLKVGDVCLITEENTSRPSWPMGRVVSQIRSRDGIVRTVKLKTAKGFLTRPVQRLHLLEPCDQESEDADPVASDQVEAEEPEKECVAPQMLDGPSGAIQGGVCSRFGRTLRRPDRLGQ